MDRSGSASVELAMLLAWFLAWPVEAYIRVHRRKLLPRGVPIAAEDQLWLRAYFSLALLDCVRVVEEDPLPIAGPPFAGAMRKLGFEFPEVRQVAAITFDCVVATREPMSRATMFHELVHVAQYRALGIRGFAREYVWGLLQSRAYEEIPLEVAAYGLEERFAAGSAEAFSVEAECRIGA